MFWRKKKKKESDPEDWESFAKELVVLHEKNVDMLVEQFRQLQELHDMVKELQRSREELRDLLNTYTKWGDLGKTYRH